MTSPRKLELMRDWPKGCAPPKWDKTKWREWSEAQHFHGLQQTQCKFCRLWRFPQELNEDGECPTHQHNINLPGSRPVRRKR